MNQFGKTIDTIQASLVWFVIVTITICIATLFLFDVLAGTGTMLFLTGGKEWQSVVISLATTGLLFALMFIGYMMSESENGWMEKVGFVVMSFAFLIYLEDVVFDALLADILRFGVIQGKVDTLQWMFRFLIGGISTVGDALAVAMISGMPVMKKIIGLSLKSATEQRPAPSYKPQQSQAQTQQPTQSHRPQNNPQPQRPQQSAPRPRPAEDVPAFLKNREPTRHQVSREETPDLPHYHPQNGE